MLIIRDLKMTFGGRTLFENASFQVNYGERVALVGPNGAGKTTLFSVILKQREPDAGTIERDEWTMVGHLPQEAEALGDETVLDVATGRVEELPLLEKRLHELEKAGDVSSPEYLETHAKYDKLNDPEVETKAKKMLRGLGYREADYQPSGERDERRLGHARAAGAFAGHGAGFAAARRTDQPPGPALAALAAELPEELFRRGPADLPRPRVHGRNRRRKFTKFPSASSSPTPATTRSSSSNARNVTSSNWRLTKTSRRKSPTCRRSPTGSARFPRRHRRRRASSNRSSGWN